MTLTHAGPDFNDNALDVSHVATILRRRRKWILLGTVLGLVLSVAYLLLTPPIYTATARVNITALGSEPVPEGRAVSSLVDIPTERQLAASALTAEGAARDLGAGWRASDISSGLTVTGDPTSSVLGVSYAATDRERAIQGADAVAQAYLEVRGTLVSERAEAMVVSIDERIAQYEQERRELVRSSPDGDVATAVRIETIDAGVQALQQRRATWSDVSTRAGEIITPASSAEVATSPVLWRVIALGLLGGLFAGVVMAAVRHRVDRVASHADDVRDLLGIDLLRPQGRYGDPRRWDAAATIAQHGNVEGTPLLVLVDDRNYDARAAADALAAAGPTRRIDLRQERAEVLRSLAGQSRAVLVLPPTWRKAELRGLAEDLRGMGTTLVGAAVADERAAVPTGLEG